MNTYYYRLVNVFAEESFGGNPLCVFEEGSGLDDVTMQALARQFNLSETTFVFPSEHATARMRIFTPFEELAFAGHPVLGTAHVVRSLSGMGEALTLEMKAGIIPVTAQADLWTLQAKSPQTRVLAVDQEPLAEALGLSLQDLDARPPLWVDTGSEQWMIPLANPEAIQRCQPNPQKLLSLLGKNQAGQCKGYVWAMCDVQTISARFFSVRENLLWEDPATGSACANLGGWFKVMGCPPREYHIHQGEALLRPSILHLKVDEAGQIFVGGRVMELGRGSVSF